MLLPKLLLFLFFLMQNYSPNNSWGDAHFQNIFHLQLGVVGGRHKKIKESRPGQQDHAAGNSTPTKALGPGSISKSM